MSDAVTLTLATPPTQSLMADFVAADRFAALGEREIAGLPVMHGGRRARGGPFPQAWLDRRARRDRPPGDVPLRLYLPAASPPAAAPLPARPLPARDRRPTDHGSVRAVFGRPGRARQGRDPAMGGGMSGEALGLNERAWEIADRLAAHAAALRVVARTPPGGARVIDAGIAAAG